MSTHSAYLKTAESSTTNKLSNTKYKVGAQKKQIGRTKDITKCLYRDLNDAAAIWCDTPTAKQKFWQRLSSKEYNEDPQLPRVFDTQRIE